MGRTVSSVRACVVRVVGMGALVRRILLVLAGSHGALVQVDGKGEDVIGWLLCRFGFHNLCFNGNSRFYWCDRKGCYYVSDQ